MNYKDLIKDLLSDPNKLLQKRPFTRGYDRRIKSELPDTIELNDTLSACLPRYRREVVTQEQFMEELDPQSHAVLFDDNIPSICIKTKDQGFVDIQFQKMAVPFQRNIKNKQLLHLTGHKMQFTLIETNPSDTQANNFVTFKQYWDLRNQDGMKNKMVDTQLSYGDAGLLYYFDYKGRIKSRILSYADGYVLCPHNDENGDRILESVYYCKDNIEYIDSYDELYLYRYTKDNNLKENEDSIWVLHEPIKHGFNEIPLITKRGDVAWNNVQNIITSYEVLYNIYNAVNRRFGWGILYVKGKFSEKAEKIAGSVILNDKSLEGKGDAKFLTPPSPQGTLDILQSLLDTIQLGASTTFILPKDVKTGGDISGIAIQLTQSLDIENALQKVIEWQNVADKMTRLFKYGLSKELVASGTNLTAITEYEDLNINAKFKVWKPMNDYEYNQMLTILTGAGILSKETGIEKNTESSPDELMRIEKEHQAQIDEQIASQRRQLELSQQSINKGGDE
jgi:hypothetical protein